MLRIKWECVVKNATTTKIGINHWHWLDTKYFSSFSLLFLSIRHTHTRSILLISYVWNLFFCCGWKKCSVLLRRKVIPFLQIIFIWFTLFSILIFRCVIVDFETNICCILSRFFTYSAFLHTNQDGKENIYSIFSSTNVRVNEYGEQKKTKIHSNFFSSYALFSTVSCVVSFYLNTVCIV